MCVYISIYTYKKRGIHDQRLEPSQLLIPTTTSPGHHFQGALVESQNYYKRESLTPPEPREDPNQGACFNRDHVGTRPRCKQPVRQLMCRLDLTVDWVMPSFLLLRHACYDDRKCMFFIPTPDRIPRLCVSQPSTRKCCSRRNNSSATGSSILHWARLTSIHVVLLIVSARRQLMGR